VVFHLGRKLRTITFRDLFRNSAEFVVDRIGYKKRTAILYLVHVLGDILCGRTGILSAEPAVGDPDEHPRITAAPFENDSPGTVHALLAR
jgi:hypothetical protein